MPWSCLSILLTKTLQSTLSITEVLVLNIFGFVRILFWLHMSELYFNYFIQMGSSNSKNRSKGPRIPFDKYLQPLPQAYIQIDSQQGKLQHPQLQSLKTYIILINSSQRSDCIKSLQIRKKHPQNLMQIRYGKLIQDNDQYIKIMVYVQFIAFNLQQLINFQFWDLLTIFYWVFKGFKVLYEEFGCFMPDPRMIGFNQQGQVKIWVNYKYAKCTPKGVYQMCDQQKMVQSLTQILLSKVNIETVPVDSHRRKFKFTVKTFDEAIKLIQNEVKNPQLIPKASKTILNLLNSGKKFKQNQIISISQYGYQTSIINQTLNKKVKFHYTDPNQLNTDNPKIPKINFSYDGKQTPRRAHSLQMSRRSSAPKVNFTMSSTPKPKVNFMADSKLITSKDMTISTTFSRNQNRHPNLSQSSRVSIFSNRTQKKNSRSTSMIRFSYN